MTASVYFRRTMPAAAIVAGLTNLKFGPKHWQRTIALDSDSRDFLVRALTAEPCPLGPEACPLERQRRRKEQGGSDG